MYESISSEVIQSLARSAERDRQGFADIQSPVVSNSLVPNLAYVSTHHGSECQDTDGHTISLDANRSYTPNPDDLDSQGHHSTADTASEDLLRECSDSAVQNFAYIATCTPGKCR